jgi:hypothetical protein
MPTGMLDLAMEQELFDEPDESDALPELAASSDPNAVVTGIDRREE